MARKAKTMDGNTAAAHVSYAFTDCAAIYPITPSSPMADCTDLWATQGRENIFGHPVVLTEMQSEAGAAGAVHGALTAGALTTTYTASQGLLLMIPNMYKIAGELLPGVINVTARAIASHALSIFGDHSDIYACRQTGFAMLCSSNVQETMDLGAVAHLTAIKGRVPFMHFFDGFRTSHEIQKIEVWDYEDLKDMVDMDAVDAFRQRALNPEHPQQRGTAQNPDVFFQAREASNTYYDAVPELTQQYMDKVNAKLGTDYKLFNYYGAADAEHIIIAMGSVCDTIEETIDYLNAAGGKYGLVKVRLYRPFSAKHLIDVIPASAKQISVLDRTKEPGALGEPLYLDVVAALKDSRFTALPVYSGRYGLGSKDTTPGQIKAVYENTEKKRFTIGIVDDVTNLSLDVTEEIDTAPAGTTSCKFWGLGADGTVGANKNSIKIIGDHTDKYVQAYFDYDSKKSGGVTISHLRFGDKKIRSTYLINKADFVACHMPAYVHKYNMVQDLKDGGSFLLNCSWTPEELDKELPGQVKKYIADHKINLYTIDGFKLGKEVGLGTRINTILQAAFFSISGIIPEEDAVKYMKDAATATYSKKGDDVVQMNHAAIDVGCKSYTKIEVPASWAAAAEENLSIRASQGRAEVVSYVNSIQNAINAQNGNSLPVSAFAEYADGTVPLGSAAYEKRGIAVDVPVWHADLCIGCNKCSLVCPHACVRPVAMTEEQAAAAPSGAPSKELKSMPGRKFAVTISVLDCTGCGACGNACPVKALSYDALETQLETQKMFNYGITLEEPTEIIEKFKTTTVIGSQFKQPLLEFSGACGGCGETPYAKLVTQLFGDRMYIANATGCSSIWGGSSPSTPYTVNKEGKGPAWANSLFEDNAEFGLGMQLAAATLRSRLIDSAKKLSEATEKPEMKALLEEFLATRDSSTLNAPAARKLVAALEACDCDNPHRQNILKNRDFLAKKSQWIFGGDGWSYDIGFGGLDHVLASGRDVNVLVFDTEVYSNTGGQVSKASVSGQVAEFAIGGKTGAKKRLAEMMLTYGHVYVAQVSMGADMPQLLKALKEAEAYPGPSLIIAYSPCEMHGIRGGGMKNAQIEMKKAVACGYFHLFRYDPSKKEQPFVIDSPAPSADLADFLSGESRFARLRESDPARAETLWRQAKEQADARYDALLAAAAYFNTPAQVAPAENLDKSPVI